MTAPMPAMGDTFEERVREDFPDFWKIVEPLLTDPDFANRSDKTVCVRCGVDVTGRHEHLAWHRQLTIAVHLNAWMAGRALTAMTEALPILEELLAEAKASTDG